MQYHDSVDPHNRNLKLDVDSSTTECDRTHFRKLIGSLIYLLITGPDLNYSINFLSAFMQTHVILIQILLSDCYDPSVTQWITKFSTNHQCRFDSKCTKMSSGLATKPIDDQPQGSLLHREWCNILESARSNQSSHCWQLHMKSYGSRGLPRGTKHIKVHYHL